MLDLVGNPEAQFSRVKAHINNEITGYVVVGVDLAVCGELILPSCQNLFTCSLGNEIMAGK